jgi:non-ribosomal peptide synthetase component F
MTLLASFGILLSRHSGQEEMVLGVATANRTRADLEHLAGFFVNMLPLRLDLAGAPSFRDLLRRVRKTSVEAFAHQELPLDMLIAEVRPTRSSVDSPLFRIAFGVQNTPSEAMKLPGLRLGSLGRQLLSVRFDLTVWVFETEGGFSINWTFSTDLFEEATIRRLHDQLIRLLEGVVQRPDEEIDALDMISVAEWQERAHLRKAQEASRHAKLLQAKPQKRRLASPAS